MSDHATWTDRSEVGHGLDGHLAEAIARTGGAVKSVLRRWFSDTPRLLTRLLGYLVFAGAMLSYIAAGAPEDLWARHDEIVVVSVGLSVVSGYVGARKVARHVVGNVFSVRRRSTTYYVLFFLIGMASAIVGEYLDPKRALLHHPIVIAAPVSFFVAILAMIAWLLPYEKKHGPVFMVKGGTPV